MMNQHAAAASAAMENALQAWKKIAAVALTVIGFILSAVLWPFEACGF